jgi:cholesterol transport system auxiliary component
MKIRMRRCLPFAALLMLCACASLTGKREPFTTYSPRYAPAPAPANAARVDWQLAIDTPFAGDTIDTTRMLVMPTPGALETYKGGRWADSVPMLLRGLLIQAFQTSNRIAGVGAVASGLHGDYLLSVDLYDFETQYRDGSPHAVIRLNAKLIDETVNRVAVARTFEADAPVAGASAAEAAAAFEQALNTLLPDVVGWTLDQGQAIWSKQKTSDTNPAR